MFKTRMILGLLSVALSATAVNAAVLTYEMSVSPDAEPVSPMSVGSGGAGDEDTGLLGDGTARFTDRTSSGNKGYYLTGTGATLTMDMRVKANLDSLSGSTRRSMGVHDGSAGRGIRIEKSGVTLVDGAGGDKGKATIDISSYHMIRITVAGGYANIYDLESTPGAWTLLAGPIALGGSGAPGEIETGGVAVNSLGGGSTTNSDFELDWLRLDVGTDRGATGDVIPGPVISCHTLLAPAEPTQAVSVLTGQAPDPSQFVYTLLNDGQEDISYAVQKVPDDASTAWLSLDHLGEVVTVGASSTVTATISTAGLEEGAHTVDLIFVDDCDPANQHTRTVNLTVRDCAWKITPDPGFNVPLCAGPSVYVFTVTNTGAADLNYTVAEVDEVGAYDWPFISLDKNSGGPVAPGESDTVTVTVDPTSMELRQTASLRFERDCSQFDPGYQQTRILTVGVGTPDVLTYHGDMDPEADNSAGGGFHFTLRSGEKRGEVVDDPDATLDGKAWRIDDTADVKTVFRTSHPSSALSIGQLPGATVLARVKTVSKTAPSGGNIMIFHDAGGTAGYHWGGASGMVKETERGIETTVAGDDQYHILRLTQAGGSSELGISRQITLYLDENPVPVLLIDYAVNVSTTPDAIGFGVDSTAGQQDVYFDWVVGTNAGAFAPGEDDACIGSLIPTEALTGACCLPGSRCEEMTAPECTAQGGLWQGARISCTGYECPLPPCPVPFADSDRDGDVDQTDFAFWQTCFTDRNDPMGAYDRVKCECLNRGDDDNDGQPDDDGDIDQFDFGAFEDCATGPEVIWSPSVAPDCKP